MRLSRGLHRGTSILRRGGGWALGGGPLVVRQFFDWLLGGVEWDLGTGNSVFFFDHVPRWAGTPYFPNWVARSNAGFWVMFVRWADSGHDIVGPLEGVGYVRLQWSGHFVGGGLGA